MTKTTFSFNQAAVVVVIALASMLIGAGFGAAAPGADLKQGEEAIADDLDAKRLSAERVRARMRDGNCSHLALLEAQQELDTAGEHTEEMRSAMQKGYVGLSYRWAMNATSAYARVGLLAQSCLQAGGDR